MKKTKNGLLVVNQEQALKVLESKKLNKGLTLLGNVGLGKSWLFEQVFHNEKIHGKQYLMDKALMHTANSISAMYSEGGMELIRSTFNYQLQGRQPLVIDDIGTEIIGSSYGNKMDVIQWLILECYSANTPIYVTSNLTLDNLTKRYGNRVVDRLKEKTFVVMLEGKSFREETYLKSEDELELIIKN